MAEIKFEYIEMLQDKDKLPPTNLTEWGAGEQNAALAFYIKPEVETLLTLEEGGYSGAVYTLLKYKGQYVLWRDSFGSCSGCDALDGTDIDTGRDYIVDTLTEGNCKRFDTMSELIDFIKFTDDYMWEDLKSEKILKHFEVIRGMQEKN